MAAAKKNTAPVGHIWEFPATERTTITRPDGEVVSDPVEGLVSHVLTVPGDYVAGEHTITAKD